MWNEDFITFDSDKGQWLLDIVAFRQWQIDEYSDGHNERADEPLDKQQYRRLHRKALILYDHLYQTAQRLPGNMKIRLFRYLSGESMENIAGLETPPVTRQAIQKSLKQAIEGMGMKQARQIWFYGKSYSNRQVKSIEEKYQ